MAYTDYIDLDYKSYRDDLVTLLYIEPSPESDFETATEAVAGESSIGTWTDVLTIDPKRLKKITPKIFHLDREKGIIAIAYPLGLFELNNIPQIMSSVAGNIFGMKIIKNMRLLDIQLPENVLKAFNGPKFGISGIRKILKVKKRPLVGTIIKPKLGLNYKEHAKVAYESWIGGCDIVKDDENLSNQSFNPFKERIKNTLKMRDAAEKETGEKKIYMPNITAETGEMTKRAEFVKKQNGEYVMVDVLTVGFSALQTLINENLNLVIHAHRAMHAALTRNPKHGISMLALAKLYRLIGMDQLHIGTVIGKMEGSLEEIVLIRDEMIKQKIDEDFSKNHVAQDWKNLKPVFPVASGGLHQGHVPKLVEILGNDVIIQAGGGIHGHPDGTISGARAMRQAVDAVMEGIPLEEYSTNHYELERALKKFGII